MSTSTQIISDVLPKTQAIATSGQTVFDTDWTADATTDILVYARADGVEPDDATQLVSSADYTVTFVGTTLTVRVTFSSGRTLDDIITIVRDTPSTRENLYTNTNFTPSMLNQDFGIHTLVDQQNQLYDQALAPHYNVSATIQDFDLVLPILGANQIWAKNNADDEIIVYDVPAGGGLAPNDATYILQIANSELANAQAMGALATGFVWNTTTTGVQAVRTLTGTTNEIDVANGTGAGGNPTFSIATNPTLPGTGYMIPPSGTTAERPGAPTDGMVRYNTTLSALEVYEASVWDPLSGGVVDSVVGTANEIDVDATDPANPILSLSATLVAPGTVTIGDLLIDTDTITNTVTGRNITLIPDTTGGVDIYAPPASEVNGINVNGVTYDTAFRVNDIGLVTPAQAILHRHSTTLAPNLLGARTNSNTDSHAAVTAGQSTLTILGAGWTATSYQLNASIDLAMDTTGTISASSAPGKITFNVTPDGAVIPAAALTITNDKKATFAGDVDFGLTDGELLIGSTGLSAVKANLTAGPGISIANAAGAITISGTGSGIGWTEVTGTTQAITTDNGYVANNVGLVTFTLPATAAFGTVINIVGKGAGGWQVDQNAGQNIQIGSVSSTVGAGGSIASSNQFDSIALVCTTADTVFTAITGPQGNITIV
jgi:hypothetical protein